VDDEVIGTTLGHCVIEELLGQGGMARVYRGRQEQLDRYVAIKLLPPYYAADPAFVERFKLEARAMARLSHPHIVTVHDTGEDGGRLYIIMEYVGGGTLKDRMETAMPLREVTRIVAEVASALSYAHSMGIVHRDVKPVNVLMDTNGRAVLSDFGIAKVLETSAALTHAGAGVGTPEYMSPEQCRGVPVDARADIYALGVMLYEMLTGRTPFQADNYTALAHSHIYEPVPPPSRLNPRISPAVQAVIMKALEKDPANRFQKATELADALEAAVLAQMPVAQGTGRPAAPILTAQPAPRPGPPSTPQRAGVEPGPGQAQVIYCPRCRSANSAQQRFCSSCGLPFGGHPQPVRNGQPPQATGGTIDCPQCHAPNPAINRFCTSCGSTLLSGVEGKKCRVCGLRNRAGQSFCTACGEPLK
jgi:serine/threonine-protein kinase